MFHKDQPDLDWMNPDVRNAIYDDMRFWLDKGLGGFRMDVINIISKPAKLPPAGDPTEELQSPFDLVCNEPTVHEYLREMRRDVLDHYDDVVSIGEVICTTNVDVIKQYTDPSRKELNMVYTFDLFGLDIGGSGKFSRRDWRFLDLKQTVVKWQKGLEYSSEHWQTIWLESHDSARSATRFGDRVEKNREKVSKMLSLLQSTLGGTMFIYQGQEIGMKNLTADIPIEKYKDLETQALIKAGLAQGPSKDEILGEVLLKARDHNRAPIAWTVGTLDDPYAGFSSKEPWSPMNTDSGICNVASNQAKDGSVLKYWQRRIKIRKEYADTLVFGDFEPVESTMIDDATFAYWKIPLTGTVILRSDEGGALPEVARSERTREVLVVINLGKHDTAFVLPSSLGRQKVVYEVLDDTDWKLKDQGDGGILFGNNHSGDRIELAAYQGLVLGMIKTDSPWPV